MADDYSPISRITGKPITTALVREIFNYDPETGLLSWRVNRGRFSCAGMPAGNLNPRGRINVKLDGRLIGAHRIIWAYMTGDWPKNEIDHRDGVPCNNTWANLREANRHQNTQNTRRKITNISGFKGVSFRKEIGLWRARITSRGRKFNLGLFTSAEAAAEAYGKAAKELHGEFARLE